MSRYRSLIVLIFSAFAGLSACTRGCNDPNDWAKAVLNADQGFQFPPGFPPDPAKPGKTTIDGIDSDRDGLRDDVQRWIYARYPNEERKRKALRQMAVYFQIDRSPINEPQELLKLARRSSKAITCLMDAFGESDEMELVRAKVLNTADRTDRYLQTDAKYDGMVLGPSYPSDGTACE